MHVSLSLSSFFLYFLSLMDIVKDALKELGDVKADYSCLSFLLVDEDSGFKVLTYCSILQEAIGLQFVK